MRFVMTTPGCGHHRGLAMCCLPISQARRAVRMMAVNDSALTEWDAERAQDGYGLCTYMSIPLVRLPRASQAVCSQLHPECTCAR